MAKARGVPAAKLGLLDDLEQLVGVKLPAEYRTFMSRFDGKLPEPRGFKVRTDYWDELNELWPLKGRHCSVAGGWGLLKGREAHLLVVGDDGSGNWVCLSVRGADRGKVFFIDQDYSPGERGRTVKLASSFAKFMASLRNLPA